MATKDGRQILSNRRNKGRKKISAWKLMSTVLLKTIKKRIDFIKVSKKGKKKFTQGFILQKYKRDFLSKEKVFSYAIISPFELSYTIFNQFSKEWIY